MEGSPQEPNAAQAMQIAEAAMKVAEEAKSAAEAKAPMEKAIQEEAEAQGVKLDKEERELMAQAFIAQLEARGAFGELPSGEPATTEPAQSPASAEPSTEPVAPPAEQHPQPPAAEEPPVKKSVAERFQGR